MRILANENIAGAVVDELCARGHDVVWVRAERPGAGDEDVLAWAVAEHRLLVTFDKDFGQLVFSKGATATCGIVLFRLRMAGPVALAKRVADVLEQRSDWQGCFSVVEEAHLRMIVRHAPPDLPGTT